MITRYLCLIVFIIFTMPATAISGEGPSKRIKKIDAETKDSLFSDAIVGVDMSGYEINEAFEKNWYAYDVTYDQGFNPLFVPFEYHCDGTDSDSMQKLTFPTLLSIKFDLVDNNICTRHPSFIFQRDKEIVNLTINDIGKVKKKMESWGHNYAVGGTIRQSGSKYSGLLKIMNTEQVLLERQFERSDYFELMGKMVLAWIEFSNGTVSNRLRHELMRPMTNSQSAIRILGESFKVKARSPSQWDIFEQILKIDPDFAEVRWWYANQKWWQNRDDKWQASMMLDALESHLVVPALREAEYQSTDELRNRYNLAFSKAKEIIPNHWVVLLKSHTNKWDKLSYREFKQLVQVVLDRPYAYSFCHKVSDKIYSYYDYQISVPLMLSVISARYNPGDGNISEFQKLVFSFYSLGYLRDSTAFINPMIHFTKNQSRAALNTGFIFDEAMDFKKAIHFYQLASEGQHDKELAIDFLLNAYLNAGMKQEARKLMSSENWNFVSDKIKPVFEGRLSQKNGDRKTAIKKFNLAQNNINDNSYYRRFLETALFEHHFEENNEEAAKTVDRLWYNSPRSRKTYHLYKKLHKDNRIKMQTYLYVTTHLFPNQTFWQNEAKEYMPFPDIDTESLILKLGNYTVMSSKGSSEGLLSGFELENICLKLLEKDPKRYANAVNVTYRSYAYNFSDISSHQRAHRRAFLSLLENIGKGQKKTIR